MTDILTFVYLLSAADAVMFSYWLRDIDSCILIGYYGKTNIPIWEGVVLQTRHKYTFFFINKPLSGQQHLVLVIQIIKTINWSKNFLASFKGFR